MDPLAAPVVDLARALVDIDSTSGDETAIVVNERKVRFREREISLTEATRLREDLSYSVAPTGYWLYEGRNLGNIYAETYPLDSL